MGVIRDCNEKIFVNLSCWDVFFIFYFVQIAFNYIFEVGSWMIFLNALFYVVLVKVIILEILLDVY
jgi:hypothetical protein